MALSLTRASHATRLQATQADWVSTDALWRAYRNWRALHRWRFDPDAPAPLTHRQFGRAIRRVFPNAERCFRTYHGERRWGYCYLRGPESIRSAWMEDRPEWRCPFARGRHAAGN